MFTLIIAVIGITILAIAAIATMFYGGGVFSGASVEAEANRRISEAQQIRAAADVFTIENARRPVTLEELTPDYLKALPEGWSQGDGVLEGNVINAENINEKICQAINVKAGLSDTEIPACSEVESNALVCCTK